MHEPSDEVLALIRKYALQNALEYGGEGQVGSVMGRVMGENPDLRSMAKAISPLIAKSVTEANDLAKSAGLDHLKSILKKESPDALEERVKERRTGLPPLPNAVDGKVVLRFAPNPNGPLSLGHARGVTINSELAKMHDGVVILRFDDTDTRIKPPDPDAYKIIEDEFTWLTGRSPDRIIRASERMPIYLEYAERLLAEAAGYVCTCPAESFKEYRISMSNCPCRGRTGEQNLELWISMLDGSMPPGGGVVRIRTDMTLPNPALRDWPALRIQHDSHPVVGDAYRVWPLLDFQSAIEDHLQGVTHIVRGKDLMDSTRKQILLYEKFEWEYPETLYWGRIKVHGLSSFSTSEMRKLIESGQRTGWGDVRLPTLKALRRRGYEPEAIRKFWVEIGLTQKDISVPMQTLDALNGGQIDSTTPRLTFVRDPIPAKFSANTDLKLPPPTPSIHPEHPNLGLRRWPEQNGEIDVLIEVVDATSKSDRFRLKDFADVEFDEETANDENVDDGTLSGKVLSSERLGRTRIIHWLPAGFGEPVIMLKPDGDDLLEIHGILEPHDYPVGTIIQLERIGYARIEMDDDGKIQLIHLHD